MVLEDAELVSPAKRVDCKKQGGFEFTPAKTRRGGAYRRYVELCSDVLTESAANRPKSAPESASRSLEEQPSAEQPCEEAVPSAKEIAAARAAAVRLGLTKSPPGAVTADSPAPKLPEGPEPVAKEIRYLAREELEPVEDITAATSKMVGDLQSGDWSAVCDALTVTRQLAACHVESLRPLLDEALLLVGKHIRSPRSQVSKSAILCLRDLVVFCTSQLGVLLEPASPGTPGDIVHSLLLKAVSTDKRFVVAEAEAALCEVAATFPMSEVVRYFAPHATQHKNFKIRGKAGVALSHAATQAGDRVEEAHIPELLGAAAKLLKDKAPEGREAARELVHALERLCETQGCELADKASAALPSAEASAVLAVLAPR